MIFIEPFQEFLNSKDNGYMEDKLVSTLGNILM